MNRWLFALAASLFVVSTTAYGQQTPEQRKALENEYASLFVGARAVSSCPALIEDWEFSVIRSLITQRDGQLAGEDGVPAQTRQNLNLRADGLSCADPDVQQEAKRLQLIAAQQWLLHYTAYKRTSGCREVIGDEERDEALDRFEPVIRAKLDTTGSQVLDQIAATATQLASWLDDGCYQVRLNPNALQRSIMEDRLRGIFAAPWWQYRHLKGLGEDTRRRKFEGLPEAVISVNDGSRLQFIGVTGSRSTDESQSKASGICNGVLGENTLSCEFTYFADGSLGLWLFHTDERGVEAINGVRMDLINARSGEVLKSVRASTGAVHEMAHFAGVKSMIDGTDGLNAIRFALDLTVNGKKTGEIVLERSEFQPGVRGFAVRDLQRAYEFAYTPSSSDLSNSGLVSRAVNGP